MFTSSLCLNFKKLFHKLMLGGRTKNVPKMYLLQKNQGITQKFI